VTTGKHLTLFYHNDDLKASFFIAETNGQPVELNYYVYYTYDNDLKRVVNADVYKRQLIWVINKFSLEKKTLIKMVENTKYEQGDLKNLIDEINDNRAAIGKKTSSTRFFVGITINNTSAQYSDDITLSASVSKATARTTISPQINLGMDIINNKNVQKVVFRGELSFSYINPKFQFPLNFNNQNTTATYLFNQYTATITPQILFNIYNKEKFKLYLDAGVGLNFSAYRNNKLTVQNTQFAGTDNNTVESPIKLEPIWFNFPVQVGVILNKKVEFALTYSAYATYTNNTNYDIRNSSVGLGVKYLSSGK